MNITKITNLSKYLNLYDKIEFSKVNNESITNFNLDELEIKKSH